jgi:hypothetical protein
MDMSYTIDRQMPKRASLDAKNDKRGDEILDLCVSSRLRILNGRKIGDTLGYFTCHKWNGSSVVDYAIVSEGLFDDISYFKVGNALLDLSDHCHISFKIKTSIAHKPSNIENILPLPSSFRWDNEAIFKFQMALTTAETKQNIFSFLNTEKFVNIDNAAERVSKIITMAADQSLRKKCSMPKKSNTKKDKNWHDNSLKQLRKALFTKGGLLTKFPNDPIIRANYFKCLKVYRKKCKQKSREFRQGVLNQLETLHESNPKGYWELLKKLKDDTATDNASKISAAEWLEYFRELNKKETFTKPVNLDKIQHDKKVLEKIPNFTELDFKINKNEITKAIKTLKNNKANGLDGIKNEFIKYSQHALLPVFHKLFNQVLSGGSYPQSWAIGYIKPLYKKENPLLPTNYRGITITSVLGKLFNTIINNRVQEYLVKNNIMRMEQIGFRKKCRTADHIFVLKTLIQKYKKDKKPIYSCFIDLRKAFDSVWHDALLYKLLELGMNGSVYQIIKSMYSKVQLQVHVGTGLTTKFNSDIG